MPDRHFVAPQHNQNAHDNCAVQLQCDHCQETAIAVSPGSEGVGNVVLLHGAVPRRQWCAACWPVAQNPCLLSSNEQRRTLLARVLP